MRISFFIVSPDRAINLLLFAKENKKFFLFCRFSAILKLNEIEGQKPSFLRIDSASLAHPLYTKKSRYNGGLVSAELPFK